MIKAVLLDPVSGEQLHASKLELDNIIGYALSVIPPCKSHGVFKTTSYTVQGTTEQVSPDGNGSIELCDLIVTFEKKANGIVTVNFHDGTNTVPIFSSYLTDAPCNMAMSFSGKWQGWKSAHIDVVVSGADSKGTIAIGYLRYTEDYSLSYSAWNARR